MTAFQSRALERVVICDSHRLEICATGLLIQYGARGLEDMKKRFLTAEWRHLVMMNYEIDPGVLQPYVPPGTEIDHWNGKCFVSVVGFMFHRTRLFGLPIPFHTSFPEVNLRFYVRRWADTGQEVDLRRAVVFIKEIAPRWAVAKVARWFYNENYDVRPMWGRLELPSAGSKGLVEYRWMDKRVENCVWAEIHGSPELPMSGSEEEFVTEHYWAYSAQRDGSVLEYRVNHPQWKIWPTKRAEFDCDVVGTYGPEFAEALSLLPSSAFVVDGSGVEVMKGVVTSRPRVETHVSTPHAAPIGPPRHL